MGSGVAAQSLKRSSPGLENTALAQNVAKLASKGLSVQLGRAAQSGRDHEELDVASLQNTYCRYAGDKQFQQSNVYHHQDQPTANQAAGKQSGYNLGSVSLAPQPPSPFQAAADAAPPRDWTDLGPLTPQLRAPIEACGQGLSQRRLSDVSCTTIDSQLHSIHQSPNPIQQLATTPLLARISPVSADTSHTMDSSPSRNLDMFSLDGSPSLPPPDMPSSTFVPTMQHVQPPSVPASSRIQMTLVSAPAAFSLPVGMHKPIGPPFQVRIDIHSDQPSQLKVKLVASLLSAEQLGAISGWDPHAVAKPETVSNGVLEQTLLCNQADAIDHMTGRSTYRGSCCMTFKDMRFAVSSRMRFRWLVIALMLPADGVLFVQYKVPTIIMSRPCDQLQQATAMLQGSTKRGRADEAEECLFPDGLATRPATADTAQDFSPVPATRLWSAPGHLDSALVKSALTQAAPVDSGLTESAPQHPALYQSLAVNGSAPMTSDCMPLTKRSRTIDLDTRQGFAEAHRLRLSQALWPEHRPYSVDRWQHLVIQIYKAFRLGRVMTDGDMHVLHHVAGFHDVHNLSPSGEVTASQWSKFGHWYISQLKMLQSQQCAWVRSQPTIICSFEIDRSLAEKLLQHLETGTFLVRPSLSSPGCMVVSTVDQTGLVKHLLLEEQQLQLRSLQVWVRDAVEAQQLLDYKTMQLWPKDKVFLQQYRRLGPVMDTSPRSRTRTAFREGHAPVKDGAGPLACSNLPLQDSTVLPRHGQHMLPVRQGLLLQHDLVHVPVAVRDPRHSPPTTHGLPLVHGHLPCVEDGFSTSLPTCRADLPSHHPPCRHRLVNARHHARQASASDIDDCFALSPPFATAAEQGPLQGVMAELTPPGLGFPSESGSPTAWVHLGVRQPHLAELDPAALMTTPPPAPPSINGGDPSVPPLFGLPDPSERLSSSSLVDLAPLEGNGYVQDNQLLSSPSNDEYPLRPQSWGSPSSRDFFHGGAQLMSSSSSAGYPSGRVPHSPPSTGYPPTGYPTFGTQLMSSPCTPQQSPPFGPSLPLLTSRLSLQGGPLLDGELSSGNLNVIPELTGSFGLEGGLPDQDPATTPLDLLLLDESTTASALLDSHFNSLHGFNSPKGTPNCPQDFAFPDTCPLEPQG